MRGKRVSSSKFSVMSLLRLSKSLLLITITLSSFMAGLPWQDLNASASSRINPSTEPGNSTIQRPQGVGADPVPDLRLPQPELSTVDDTIGEGGVIQTSPDNITLY